MVTQLPWQPELNLNNSLVLSRIEFKFGRKFFGTIGINHIPRCYGNSVAIATKVKPQ